MDTTLVKTIVDTTFTKADTTIVNTAVNTVVEKTELFADKTMIETFAIIGGILLILVGLLVWDVIDEKRNSKK